MECPPPHLRRGGSLNWANKKPRKMQSLFQDSFMRLAARPLRTIESEQSQLMNPALQICLCVVWNKNVYFQATFLSYSFLSFVQRTSETVCRCDPSITITAGITFSVMIPGLLYKLLHILRANCGARPDHKWSRCTSRVTRTPVLLGGDHSSHLLFTRRACIRTLALKQVSA